MNESIKMKTIIHVNQHVIRSNSRTGDRNPVLTCKNYKENNYAYKVDVLDMDGNSAGRFVYSPDKPLPCGAKVWFETENKIRIIE